MVDLKIEYKIKGSQDGPRGAAESGYKIEKTGEMTAPVRFSDEQPNGIG
jgi:hypothetical protein